MILEARKASPWYKTVVCAGLRPKVRPSLDRTYHNRVFALPDIFERPVIAKFDQRQGSSDGGAILLKAADRRLGLTSALAACLREERQPGKILHEMEELLTQRVMGMALGYEDANDAARLACDPVHKLLVGRDPIDGEGSGLAAHVVAF